jgi:hypothetical protein
MENRLLAPIGPDSRIRQRVFLAKVPSVSHGNAASCCRFPILWRPPVILSLPLLLLATLCMTGCGSLASTNSSRPLESSSSSSLAVGSNQPGACGLITSAEAASAIGLPVRSSFPGGKTDVGSAISCAFLTSNSEYQLGLELDQNISAPAFANFGWAPLPLPRGQFRAVFGLGNRGLELLTPPIAVVAVLHGSEAVVIALVSRRKDLNDAAVELAKSALQRLPPTT